MPAYLHPGVYLEEIGSGARPVDAVATSVTAFVGEAARGPIATPTLVHSEDNYEGFFGPPASATDMMGLAAAAFYRNGGKDAYFVRVADPSTANTKAAALDLDGETASDVVTVLASSAGAWGNAIFVNGMVRPCSCPASDKLARGAKTRSTPCLRQHRLRLP